MLYDFSDIKTMYDWGYFTDQEVFEFVPICISAEQFNEIIGKDV